MNGAVATAPDSPNKYLKKGKSLWMNDRDWLVMPFKLFDAGVNLKYADTGKTMDSTDAYILKLTFNNVRRNAA